MRDWIDCIEAHTKAQKKYDKEHTQGIYLKLNLRTDLDIIRWFWEQPSKQGAVKRLIREEIARKRRKEQGAEALSGEPWNNGVGAPLCRESLLR